MPVTHVNNDSHFQELMNGSDDSLTIIDFTASWCGPCQIIAPFFEQMSNKYPECRFLKVDVDQCAESATSMNVNSMPTFIFVRNRNNIAVVRGANPNGLEAKIVELCQTQGTTSAASGDSLTDEEIQGGHVNLAGFINESQCECLNESDDHGFQGCLSDDKSRFLQSDCDEQLILNITFNQYVRIHSIRIQGPSDKGPKVVKIFTNQVRTLDFDQADSMEATQEFDLKQEDIEENVSIPVRYVKFQHVLSLQLFIKSNQNGGEITQVNKLTFIGSPVNTTNMNNLKNVGTVVANVL